MSITIGNNEAVQGNTQSAHGILTAKKAKGQQEIEGQMALNLIQSASVNTQAPVGNSGHNINIAV